MMSTADQNKLALPNYPSCSNQIDPEQAKFLFDNHCAVLILEQLPIGSEFGFDLNCFKIGEKFKGIKLIPPGIHLIYASPVETSKRVSLDAQNKQPTLGPKCGFYHHFKPKEVVIKRWSVEDEEFDISFAPDEEYHDRYARNLHELDRFLGCYNFENYKTYSRLTNKLSQIYVDRLMPKCKLIRAIPYLVYNQQLEKGELSSSKRIKRVSMVTSKPTEETLLPDLQSDIETVINFTTIPQDHLGMPKNFQITPQQITNFNLDSTLKFEGIFNYDHNKLLAEFQFAFFTFITCHVYECFEQWKKLLALVCNIDSGLKKYTPFFREFVEILRCQLEQIPEDLFADIIDTDNLIRHLFDIFLQNVGLESSSNDEVMDELKRDVINLRSFVESKFNWKFNLELDDEQPVIVEPN